MILDYLKKHPNAGDTLEGITKWWLAFQKIDATVDEVAAALDVLLHKGMIKYYETSGGQVYFKINDKLLYSN